MEIRDTTIPLIKCFQTSTPWLSCCFYILEALTVGFWWLTDEDEFFFFFLKNTKSLHLWSVTTFRGIYQSLGWISLPWLQEKSGENPSPRLQRITKKYIGLAIQIITLSIISAIKQCKENCMETVKCELYSSQGPAVYLANWSFRALLMYLFQLPANPRLIWYKVILFQRQD